MSNTRSLLRLGLSILAGAGVVLAAVAYLAVASAPGLPDPAARSRIEQNRTRLRALAAATAEPERFDTLLASFAATSSSGPEDLRIAVSEIERLRAAERAGRVKTGELESALTDLSARLDALETPRREPLPMLAAVGAASAALLLGFTLTAVALRRYSREREAVAIIVDLEPGLAHSGRLPDSVRRRVYDERLAALRSRERPAAPSPSEPPLPEASPRDCSGTGFGLIEIPRALLDLEDIDTAL